MKIDLHLHTNYSDGKLSPEKLLKFAWENHYEFLSITDHDSTLGYQEACNFLSVYPLELIPGVEISTNYQTTDVHILAYYFDVNNEELVDMLKKIYDSRYGRAKQIVQNLNQLGIDLQWEDVLKYAGKHKYIGRPHIARALIENGFCKTIKSVFDNYLNNDSPIYVPKYRIDTAHAIEIIKNAGGIPVVAHPGRLEDDNLLYEFIDMGIEGIEVYYASHSTGQIKFYEQIALEHNLIRTGGSDFHGSDFYYLNYSAPDICIKELKSKYNHKRGIK
ncbi:MAG TPA: PHP domain-containing protein [Candidatus Cloacimonadota bacterium]|jgi:predicted metal-dependent phosphoesterase TrpH|nr:PHP domain-containing protein [Candidatus Cloacimonadota bacterium]HPK40428.1 PHP domain-containing protein [Candidatus Cloacimonadota bacterium]HPY95960.1 PHP domain-containing protein [Candidatus Cloacimonadota bacterium]HQB40420.1 PHP domain-containing protein [Candidatus Cloacimonadota bacterium]